MSLLNTNRTVRLWEFRVSHRWLLLRSPKGDELPTNLDVRFGGVEYIDIPSRMDGLRIEYGGDEELRRVEEAVGQVPKGRHVFVLTSGERRFLIVANTMFVDENQLGYLESSLGDLGRMV